MCGCRHASVTAWDQLQPNDADRTSRARSAKEVGTATTHAAPPIRVSGSHALSASSIGWRLGEQWAGATWAARRPPCRAHQARPRRRGLWRGDPVEPVALRFGERRPAVGECERPTRHCRRWQRRRRRVGRGSNAWQHRRSIDRLSRCSAGRPPRRLGGRRRHRRRLRRCLCVVLSSGRRCWPDSAEMMIIHAQAWPWDRFPAKRRCDAPKWRAHLWVSRVAPSSLLPRSARQACGATF